MFVGFYCCFSPVSFVVATFCLSLLWLLSVFLCCGYFLSFFVVATFCLSLLWLLFVFLTLLLFPLFPFDVLYVLLGFVVVVVVVVFRWPMNT